MLVPVCVALWATLLWVSLPKALHLQAGAKTAKAFRTLLKTNFQVGWVARMATLVMAIVKLKF
jgi:hypothetical protein